MAGFQDIFAPTGTTRAFASRPLTTLRGLGVPALAIAGITLATRLGVAMPDPSAVALMGAGLTGLAILGTSRKPSD